jgi:RimJ/RimL family protein N-acetyltransferase
MPDLVTGPAYRIRTPRLVVRCWEPADAPLFKAAIDASIEHLRPWMPWAAGEPQSLQAKIDLLRRFRGQFDLGQDFVYGILSADEAQVLGGTGLHTRPGKGAREIGYWLHKDHTGRGYASEATAALTRVAFEVDKVSRVEIHCVVENVRSAAVPRKLGYTHEATLRQRVPSNDGRSQDAMIWTLLADEYPSSPAAAMQVEAYDAAGRRIL